MEPPPVAADGRWRVGSRRRRRPAGAPRQSVDLISIGPAQARSVLTAAALAAIAVGLVGTDAGVLWVVAGVWTVRSVAGAGLNLAWGIAVIGTAMRWGTLSLGDVAVATSLVGPSVASGSIVVRTGIVAALAAAVLGECREARWDNRNWGERLAAAGALTVLVPLFVLGAPTPPLSVATLWWVVPVALVTLVSLVGRPYLTRVPAWIPPVVAAVGVVAATTAP